jgi:hypothetical protein
MDERTRRILAILIVALFIISMAVSGVMVLLGR